jgi:hypothetical protein
VDMGWRGWAGSGSAMAASLDLEKWPERSIIIGVKMLWNQFLKLAEKARSLDYYLSYLPFLTKLSSTR